MASRCIGFTSQVASDTDVEYFDVLPCQSSVQCQLIPCQKVSQASQNGVPIIYRMNKAWNPRASTVFGSRDDSIELEFA